MDAYAHTWCDDIANYFLHAAIVTNIGVTVTSATSVRVSWDRLDIPEITGYIVYYSQTEMVTTEQSVNVPSSQNSVLIEDLMTDVEYQFEVVAVAELDGVVVMGERSERAIQSVIALLTDPTGFFFPVYVYFSCVCVAATYGSISPCHFNNLSPSDFYESW